MFPLIETIKILNGQAQHLAYHQHRFEASYYKLYKKLTTIKLADVIQVPKVFENGLVKLRFLYNEADCFCQYDNYQPKKIATVKLVADDKIDYSLKWVNRKPLENLLQHKGQADEILIIKNRRITDTSYTNIVFFDGKDWLTPKYPLLHGTARARLLNENKIKAMDIFIDDLSVFQSFKLINAMLDFESQPAMDVKNLIKD